MSLNKVSAHTSIGRDGAFEIHFRASAELTKVRPLQRLVEQIKMEMLAIALNNC